MNRSTARWIAIALVGAMIAAVAVGLLGGDGDQVSDLPARDPAAATTAVPVNGEVTDGPHAVIEFCANVACPAPDEDTQQALVDVLAADPRVALARLVTSEQAYALFVERYGDREDLVATIDPRQVPARIEVDLFDPTAIDLIAAEYGGRPGVASVYDARRVAP
jgi:hypothetical protein